MSWEKGLSRAILIVVSVVYAYGAFVHVNNLAGGYGFPGQGLPVKWVAVDVLFTGLSLLVAGGLILAARIAVGAFFVAASGQVLLATAYRDWVADVPAPFLGSATPFVYFDALLPAQALMVPAVALALFLRWAR